MELCFYGQIWSGFDESRKGNIYGFILKEKLVCVNLRSIHIRRDSFWLDPSKHYKILKYNKSQIF